MRCRCGAAKWPSGSRTSTRAACSGPSSCPSNCKRQVPAAKPFTCRLLPAPLGQAALLPNDESPAANDAFARQAELFTIGSSPVAGQASTHRGSA
ncbi:protein of unknown function [Pseudomonas inefficax]|uniref:Uncharacterized protein n=1 Tax=Pseudomonas inefficax TaxID=2078786 RepID=A0AAQ1PCJ8_9PSED|nr:protein of unknown function [Pseudomonas inefficax]